MTVEELAKYLSEKWEEESWKQSDLWPCVAQYVHRLIVEGKIEEVKKAPYLIVDGYVVSKHERIAELEKELSKEKGNE